MAKDTTSIPRTTKRIGSLRFFIKHRGTTKKNFGKASNQQVTAWKRQLKEELALRDELRAAAAAEAESSEETENAEVAA